MTSRQFLDTARKAVPSAEGFVITTLPRGDLQVAQPSQISESLLRAYARGFHREDCLTWQSIVRRKALRPSDCWNKETFKNTDYAREWLAPAGLAHVVVVPLAAPVLEGYPGALHLARTADQGDFSDAEVNKLTELARQYDAKVEAARASRRSSNAKGAGAAAAAVAAERPPVRFAILDGNQKPKFAAGRGGQGWSSLD